MNTIGKFLKDSRVAKRYSLKKLESGTKIKKEFIENIESEKWQGLPDFTIVAGFVKNIASYLKVDKRTAFALLKRDYPPQTLLINPKPEINNRFTWTPKLTFLAGVLIVLLAIIGYLGFQYMKFTTPPPLEVLEPKEGEIVDANEVDVSGKTDPDAVVRVNNQLVLITQDGKFTAKIEIFEGTTNIVIKALSRSGKETTITRTIKPRLEK